MENKKKIILFVLLFVAAAFLYGIFVPKSPGSTKTIMYAVQKGASYRTIGADLAQKGIAQNPVFFDAYVLATLQYGKLKAGMYELSPADSIANIANKFARGDTAKTKITIIEGWDTSNISLYLQNKNMYSKQEFSNALNSDFSADFSFLADRRKGASLEGYMFPDTYYLGQGESAQDFIKLTLSNFDKKLTPDLREEIKKQKKTIFQIVTMASLLEKEANTLSDKKIISGILWKRIKEGIPLQVDATVNYITGKNSASVSIEDTKIDSPYNTYKYYGLPKGPIANAGMDSITAAIYPTKTDYWYYLSDDKGNIIFSKTLQEHNNAIAKYIR